MARKYVTCSCGTRNDREGGRRKCVNCGRPLPKRRVPAHARALRDNSYAHYVQVAREIHGVADESCCVCGKPRPQSRHHDRDHFHRGPFAGLPRGLACGGNQGCNVLMLPWIDAVTAWAIADAKVETHDPDSGRWGLIGEYLSRAETFYAAREDAA